MNDPKKIILHCSATDDREDISAATIDKWHKKRGWRGIGYHYVIRRDGEIEIGRPEAEIGAHTRGHNKNSIGICLIGTARFTHPQYRSLMSLLDNLMDKFQIRISNIYGHNEFTISKTCPNLPMVWFRHLLAFHASSATDQTSKIEMSWENLPGV